MNTYFPLTTALNRDAEKIIQAMDTRAEEISDTIAAQSYLKTITVVALKGISLAAGMTTVASLPVAAFTVTFVPLTIAASSLAVAITCMAIGMLLDPRSPGESIVKDYWKALFGALRHGNGSKIVETSQDLAKQERHRKSAFKSCVGSLSSEEIRPFFHKTSVVGYLILSIQFLAKNEIDKAQSNAKMALSYFERSGFSDEISQFVQALANSPNEMRQLLEIQPVGDGVYGLDILITLKRKAYSEMLKQEEIHAH